MIFLTPFSEGGLVTLLDFVLAIFYLPTKFDIKPKRGLIDTVAWPSPKDSAFFLMDAGSLRPTGAATWRQTFGHGWRIKNRPTNAVNMLGTGAANLRQGFRPAGKVAANLRQGFRHAGTVAANLRQGFRHVGTGVADCRQGFRQLGRLEGSSHLQKKKKKHSRASLQAPLRLTHNFAGPSPPSPFCRCRLRRSFGGRNDGRPPSCRKR